MLKSKDTLEAVKWLDQNEVVAIPTETVYGLAANIHSKEAIKKIYTIKNRPLNNPLIVHIKSEQELSKYAQNIPLKATILAKTFWPGPLTLLLKKSPLIPDYITANKETVALRVPDHRLTLQLLQELDYPIAAPSANPSNCVSATKASHVVSYFENVLPFVLDGGSCSKGIESTIIGFENDEPVVYRLGSLTLEKIELVVGKVKMLNNLQPNQNPTAPGMFTKHYAPKTPLYVVGNVNYFLEMNDFRSVVFIGFNKKINHDSVTHQLLLSSDGDVEEAASKLYSTLIKADAFKAEVIVVEWFENKNLGMSINDRLKRASSK